MGTGIKHADIIPLIGGMTLGSSAAFGSPPEFLLSYEAFKGNDSHIVNHMPDVPYVVLDSPVLAAASAWRSYGKVDVVSSTCPCAGLSMMSHGYGDQNPNNDWMPKVAEFVMGTMKPAVYWGENAPGFAGKIGNNVRANLRKIGLEHGYSMSVYRTKSLLHGLCQVRERSFYFFWKGDKVPLLNYIDREANHDRIEDVILNAKGNSQTEPINPKTPSQDPYYRYVLEEVHGGITHREFVERAPALHARGNDVISYLERYSGHDYPRIAKWMHANGFQKAGDRCLRMDEKLKAGGNVMRRGTIIPKDFIGAFVGHYPTCLTHPVHDRYINYREAMTIMGLPSNFELLDPEHSSNHICQNVPVTTAFDMAGEVAMVLRGYREFVDSRYVMQYNHSRHHEILDRETQTLEAFSA